MSDAVQPIRVETSAPRTSSLGEGAHGAAGFSLVELLVTIAVLTILLGVAVPSFRDTSMDLRQTSRYNRLAGDLRFARLEGIRLGGDVTVCARATPTSCGDDWSRGWHVYLESEGGSTGEIDAGEEVLRSHSLGGGGGSSLAARAITRSTALGARTTIGFDSRGRTDWTLGTFVLCDERRAPEARALIVYGAGGLRGSSELATGTDTVVDAFGNAVSCPV